MEVQSPAQKSQSTTMRILEEVAAARGVDPISLDPPLGSVIDPDALDTLAQDEDQRVAIEFSYAGCHVAVTGGDVSVEARPDIE